jgi:translation initiation factor IF-1
MSNKENETLIQGTVIEALPNVMFRIVLDNDKTIIAYLAGKMRMHRIKVIIGDKVEMVEDPIGNRHRIVRRL